MNDGNRANYASSTVLNSKFSNSTTQGLTILFSNILISNTSFDSLSHANASGGAFSIYNADGSTASIVDCKFTNNLTPKIGNADDGNG